MLIFGLALSFVAALLSGLAPAWRGSKADVVSALKDDSQAPVDKLRLRNAFVVGAGGVQHPARDHGRHPRPRPESCDARGSRVRRAQRGHRERGPHDGGVHDDDRRGRCARTAGSRASPARRAARDDGRPCAGTGRVEPWLASLCPASRRRVASTSLPTGRSWIGTTSPRCESRCWPGAISALTTRRTPRPWSFSVRARRAGSGPARIRSDERCSSASSR